MSKYLRWGIVGTGAIAKKFAEGLSLVSNAQLIAVASRSAKRAKEFCKKYKLSYCHTSYQDLADNPNIDVVYIATPHTMHKRDTLMCLEAGKSVLCEKPFAMNANEAEHMIRTAKDLNLFLMEAMWVRFLPLYRKVKSWLDEKTIGDIRLVESNFGFRASWLPKKRLLNKDLGGGALLDVGIYPVSLSSWIFKQAPSKIVCTSHIGKTGIDEQTGCLFLYSSGAISVLTCSIRTNTSQETAIYGTKGNIKILSPCWRATKATITASGFSQSVYIPLEGNGYNYEASEVTERILARETESRTMSLEETLSIMKTMDNIRSQCRLKYPADYGDSDNQ